MKDDNFGFAVILSGNGSGGPYLYRSGPARPASTNPNKDAPDHYQTTYYSKTKIVVFYSLIDQLAVNKPMVCPLKIARILRRYQDEKLNMYH